MDNKILKSPYIELCGNSANEVTGSAYLVRYLNFHILLDYGFAQTANADNDWAVNSKRHKDIKPKKLDAIILSHLHYDHSAGIPKLFADGCDCPIYVVKGSKSILTLMWQDNLKIAEKEHEKSGRALIYNQQDIDNALNHIVEIEFRERTVVNENISFTFYSAQHIVKASQIFLELTDGITTKKIGYTGDFSDYSERYYLDNLDVMPPCDVLIGESTYGDSKRTHKSRDRKTDENKLDMAIKNAKEKKGKVIIPVFSLNRLQDILATIHQMYDGSPPIKVLIDSPLGKSISKEWKNVIEKDVELWAEIKSSNNYYWIKDFSDTMKFCNIKEPMVVLAGGGMLQGGKSTYWIKEHLGVAKNYIIFSGFAHPETLAGKIKNGDTANLTIDKKKIRCKANILDLKSFSSHADFKHLIEYYTKVRYNKIILVHGDDTAKKCLADELRKSLSKADRTSRVIISNRDIKIHF